MRTRVRSGDPDAFAELFDGHARTVYNHAFRLTGDWSVAEDVMSAVFMEAWRMRARADPEGGSLRPWLLGITTNLARNHCRSNRRYRAAAAAAGAAAAPVPDHADEVAGRLDDRQRIAVTLSRLGALRRPERVFPSPSPASGRSARLLPPPVCDLLRGSHPPAALTAALYKAAAKIPGVVLVAEAADAAGRQGVAVARLDEASGQCTEWIFARDTLVFLGERTVQVSGSSGEQGLIKPGTVVSTSAVLTCAVVDRIKKIPAGSR